MPVSGRELSTLDFANLIGGPLNAVVEAQAKSAITTANFIREVALDKDNKVVNVEFSYNKKNEGGNDQKFTLTVPFLTMLPVPYITVERAVIEFNAKVTSTNLSSTKADFGTEVNSNTRGRWWFGGARLNTKTSYKSQTSTSEKAERSFDMKIRVEAGNLAMPEGTERLLAILEEAVTERKQSIKKIAVRLVAFGKDATDPTKDDPKKVKIEASNTAGLATKTFVDRSGTTVTIDSVADGVAALTADLEEGMIGKTVEVAL